MPDDHPLGDGPVEEKYVQLLNAAMAAVDEAFNGSARGADRKVGIIMLVFPYGEGEGRCNYISNGADRRDVVTMLKAQVARFEGQPDIVGHG